MKIKSKILMLCLVLMCLCIISSVSAASEGNTLTKHNSNTLNYNPVVITVHVLDSNSQPLENVNVYYHFKGTKATIYTNTDKKGVAEFYDNEIYAEGELRVVYPDGTVITAPVGSEIDHVRIYFYPDHYERTSN